MSTQILDPYQVFAGIPRDGLVAEYKFSNNYNDTSGNAYDGINNGTTPTTDRKSAANSAIQCVAASSQFVDIDASLGGLATNTKGTICTWINPTSITGVQMIITWGDTDALEAIQIRINAGKLECLCVTGGTTRWLVKSTNVVFSNGVWFFIALVTDGINPFFKIDDVLVPQSFTISSDKTQWFNNATGLDNGRIGDRNNNSSGEANFLDAKNDDSRAYNRNLTDSELTQLYNE